MSKRENDQFQSSHPASDNQEEQRTNGPDVSEIRSSMSNAHATPSRITTYGGRQNSEKQSNDFVDNSEKKSKGKKSEFWEWAKALLIAVLVVFLVRQFLFVSFIVNGDSMQPNFATDERLIVNKLVYQFSEPDFGDVVVFNVPEENRKFIKRVIAVPGETVQLEGDQLMINGELIEEPYIQEAVAASNEIGEIYNGMGIMYNYPNPKNQAVVVPEGYVFALGDNRGNSKDSRNLGFIKQSEIVGRADIIYWPLKQLEWIKKY
ncbi:signal peptidase I [Paenibacillus yanchengensis]|uniref:Signal peptidase I n=1 Tax=Paenibacillus yanchengensis TaxID=2035833 RepID=A0ABW4YM92_9BACL